MKAALIVVLFALGTMFVPAQTASRQPERATFDGREYVRLGDWARDKGFEVNWVKRDEVLQLTSPRHKLVFIVNSREARINNITVWLLLPVETRGDRVFVSQLDVQTTLLPLIAPDRLGVKIKTICLDPGHGGKDPGNRNGKQNEKQYTLLLAKEVSAQLKQAGFKVVFTRSWDTFVDLSNRPGIARKRKADLFISLHFNGTVGGRDEARGAETYALTPAGGNSTAGSGGVAGGSYPGNRFNDFNMLLAYQIQKALVGRLGTEDRGVRRARFEVLREAAMPAVLVEGGFMSHPTESKKIYDATYRKEMARAIVDGILAYKRHVE